MNRGQQATALRNEGLSWREVSECMGVSERGAASLARRDRMSRNGYLPQEAPHNPPPAVTCQCGTDVQDIRVHNAWHGQRQLYRWKR